METETRHYLVLKISPVEFIEGYLVNEYDPPDGLLVRRGSETHPGEGVRLFAIDSLGSTEWFGSTTTEFYLAVDAEDEKHLIARFHRPTKQVAEVYYIDYIDPAVIEEAHD